LASDCALAAKVALVTPILARLRTADASALIVAVLLGASICVFPVPGTFYISAY
jgi:hypothetical protein